MITARDLLYYFDSATQEFLDRVLYINDPNTTDSNVLLNHAHTRMLIDTVSPKAPKLDGITPYQTISEFETKSNNLIQALNSYWTKGGAITPLHIIELAALPQPTLDPLDPLTYYLQLLELQFRGYFTYQTGTSDAFKLWLKDPDPKAVIPERKAINCWELILYVAIVAALVPKNIVATAYNEKDIAVALYNALDGLSKGRKLGGVVKIDRTKSPQVQLAPGDVVLIPVGDNATGDDMMHHVVGITAKSENNQYEDYKAMQSWASYAGGIPDRIVLGSVLGSEGTNKFFRVVRLAGTTPLTGNV